jgi:hypothetical protein
MSDIPEPQQIFSPPCRLLPAVSDFMVRGEERHLGVQTENPGSWPIARLLFTHHFNRKEKLK